MSELTDYRVAWLVTLVKITFAAVVGAALFVKEITSVVDSLAVVLWALFALFWLGWAYADVAAGYVRTAYKTAGVPFTSPPLQDWYRELGGSQAFTEPTLADGGDEQ